MPAAPKTAPPKKSNISKSRKPRRIRPNPATTTKSRNNPPQRPKVCYNNFMTEETGARKGVRLNKFLAERLGISRREADDLIRAEKIMLNGETAIIGSKVDKTDKVCYNGKELPAEAEYVYYLLNKPVGYVCSRNKQGAYPTIYELLPKNMQRLKNVGRLDRTSSGVLLLTNDGDLGFQLTHPQFVKQKVYEVTIHKPLTPEDRRKITEEGVPIADGLSRFEIADNLHATGEDTPLKQQKAQRALKRQALQDAKTAAAQSAANPDDAEAAKLAAAAQQTADNAGTGPDGFHLIVTLTEGRNRQIRRTFSALGYNVLTLHRTRFGKYELGDLKPGEYRPTENLYATP